MGNEFKPLGVGLAVAIIAIAATSSANAKCARPDPIFGMKTYYDDKYCKKLNRNSRPLARKATARRTTITRHEGVIQLTAASAKIKEMQKLLSDLGYDPGLVDGRNGPATRRAATAFRSAVGLPANASIQNTIAVLKRLSGK